MNGPLLTNYLNQLASPLREQVRKYMEKRSRKAVALWAKYVDAATNIAYALIDSKLSYDLSHCDKFPECVISPFAQNNTTERKHAAIYVKSITLQKLYARRNYQDSYVSLIHSPFKCNPMQEAYFAFIISIYILFKSGQLSHKHQIQDQDDNIQHRILYFTTRGRQALTAAVNATFYEVLAPEFVYDCFNDDHRTQIEELLLSGLRRAILEPLYVEGSFGLPNYDPRYPTDVLSSDILSAKNIFGNITILEDNL